VGPKIVLAIEPASAERVARAGGELAAALGASVVLAHVRNDPPLFNSVRERERARHRAMGGAASCSGVRAARCRAASRPRSGSSSAWPRRA
jgi:hypothetical protein